MSDDEKAAQEKRPLDKIGDSFKKIIVVGENIKLCRDENCIVIISIRDFLLKRDSFEL